MDVDVESQSSSTLGDDIVDSSEDYNSSSEDTSDDEPNSYSLSLKTERTKDKSLPIHPPYHLSTHSQNVTRSNIAEKIGTHESLSSDIPTVGTSNTTSRVRRDEQFHQEPLLNDKQFQQPFYLCR